MAGSPPTKASTIYNDASRTSSKMSVEVMTASHHKGLGTSPAMLSRDPWRQAPAAYRPESERPRVDYLPHRPVSREHGHDSYEQRPMPAIRPPTDSQPFPEKPSLFKKDEHGQYRLPPIHEVGVPLVHGRLVLADLTASQALRDLPLDSTRPSSTPAQRAAIPNTPPEYSHSPNHSRKHRLSAEHDLENERGTPTRRLHASPQFAPAQRDSPPMAHGRHYEGSWHDAPPPHTSSGPAPSYSQSGRSYEAAERDQRQTLPSLPHLRHEDPRHSRDAYYADSRGRHSPGRPPFDAREADHYRQPPPQGYSTHGHRGPLPGPAHPYDRTPFSPGAYPHSSYPDSYVRIGDIGVVPSADSKQRKRRGNLPKETTDKLRNWFINHLQHPYPSEDEKQQLMTSTGLQMSKFVADTCANGLSALCPG